MKQVKKMTLGQFTGRQLYNEIDTMMKEIEAFHRKNIFIDATTRSVIHKIHTDYDEDEDEMTDAKEQAKERALELIERQFEQRLLQRKLKSMREEHAILKKHELWGK